MVYLSASVNSTGSIIVVVKFKQIEDICYDIYL